MEAAPIVEDAKAHSEILLFNRWSYDDVQVPDIFVEDYITATASKKPIYMPHTSGRYQARRFRKAAAIDGERNTWGSQFELGGFELGDGRLRLMLKWVAGFELLQMMEMAMETKMEFPIC